MMIQITRKAGVDGRLFGSVTNFDIAEALTKQGFAVEKAQVRMPTARVKRLRSSPRIGASRNQRCNGCIAITSARSLKCYTPTIWGLPPRRI